VSDQRSRYELNGPRVGALLGWLLALGGVAFGCTGKDGDPPPDGCMDSICGPSSGGDGATGQGGSGAGKGGKGGSSGNTGGKSGSGGGDTGGSGGASGGSGGASGGSGGSKAGSGGSGGATGGSGGSGGSTGGSSSGTGGSCSGDECGPLAELDLEFYKCNVEPIFDRGCSMQACHGDLERPFRMFARGRLRNDEPYMFDGCLRNGTTNLNEMGTGTVMCEGSEPHTETEWQLNFESARSFMRQDMSPDDSELLSQPTVGGLPHVGVHPFVKDDESYTMVRRWLSGETLGTTCDPGFN
jgi:hypothetical protein